ncbi:hypothetical protein Tco_1331782, partial [Tanacetum coccineum]
AKLYEEPEQSLIPPSREVNADDTADKSLSRASVQPVTQSKAPTDLKTKKKRIPPSSKPKSPYKVRVILPKKQVAETQHVEVTVVTADATKSLVAFELANEQGNQPSAAEAKKVLYQNAEEEKDVEFVAMEETMHDSEETADIHEDSDSDLQSMPDDDLRSVSGLNITDSDDTHENEVSKSDHIFQDDNAFAERLSLPDHMDHICDEVSSLHLKLEDIKSSIVQQVSAEIKSSLPALVTTTLKKQLPRHLLATLKDCLPLIINESLQTHIPAASKQFAETQTQLNRKVVKQLNMQFNISYVAQSNRFVSLQKELSKVLKSEMAKFVIKKVHVVGLEGGEHQSAKTIPSSKLKVESQKEQPADLEVANKESTPPVSDDKTNKGKELVFLNSEEKKSKGIVLVKDDLDEDDKQPLSKRFKIITPIHSKHLCPRASSEA